MTPALLVVVLFVVVVVVVVRSGVDSPLGLYDMTGGTN